MKIYLEINISDDQVAIAQENGPGANGEDLSEWLARHLESDNRTYFQDLGFDWSVSSPLPQEIYTYLHLE